MIQLIDILAACEAFVALPDGAVLERIGRTIKGPGGTWVAGAFRVGPCHWYSATVPIHTGRGKAVAKVLPWTDLDLAEQVADGLAVVAAS